MKTERIYLREGREDVTLTAYVLDDSPEMLNGKRRPAVLVCPGGAYLTCSDREGEPVAIRFAAMGYHAFVLRYSRYAGVAGMSFDFSKPLSVKEETIHPAPVQDIALAMRTIHERAEEWLVDLDKIALCGFSAGSHNCAMYSVYWDKPLIEQSVGAGLRPAASILCYGLSDYVIKDEMQDLRDKGLSDAANIALAGTTDPDMELRRALSPAYLVSGSTPPTFLWATAADALVPSMQTLNMATALAVQGVPFELHVFEQGDHGLSLAMQASASARSQIMPDVAAWMDLAERWLLKRFVLPLPEKTMWES